MLPNSCLRILFDRASCAPIGMGLKLGDLNIKLELIHVGFTLSFLALIYSV